MQFVYVESGKGRAMRAELGLAILVLASCHHAAGVAPESSGGVSGGSSGGAVSGPAAGCAGPTGALVAASGLPFSVRTGFTATQIAKITKARELAMLPNGDLLVGTQGTDIYIVPSAESDTAHASVFVTLPEGPAQGVAYGNGTVYAASNTGVWKIAYTSGAQSGGTPTEIAKVRQGIVAPHSDGDVHTTSSIVVGASTLYVGVGSSCNACKESDLTRATIQQMAFDGSGMTTLATRIRNPIALAIQPGTGTLWAGGAGQDDVTPGHPYEYMDAVTLHAAPIDYGWPACEENHAVYVPGSDCAPSAVPLVEFTAYATHIGAVFYTGSGAHAFPAAYRGGLFVASHGSWHTGPATPPQVAFVPMSGDTPCTAVNWNDPTMQWSTFAGGMGTTASTNYSARPTGIAVGTEGSLFFADDQNGAIYRVRPN